MDDQYSLNLEVPKSDTTSTSSGGPFFSQGTPFPRFAAKDDIPRVLEWARQFHLLSPWNHHRFDETRMRTTIEFLIQSPDHCLIVHDHGMIAGSISRIMFGDALIAQEIAWYAEEDGKSLLEAFELWAYTQGADEIGMVGLEYDDPKRNKVMERLYRRMGYRVIEKQYSKKVS